MSTQVNKEKQLQKEQEKQSRHITKQTSRGRKWMGGSVAGSYMLSMEPRAAPFYEDENVWKKKLAKHDQNRNLNEPIHLERMRTIDLMSLRHRTDEVGTVPAFPLDYDTRRTHSILFPATLQSFRTHRR